MLLTTIHLAVADNGDGGLVLAPDLSELVMGLVAFLLLMVAMFKFVFPKLNETLEERGTQIQGKLEEADAKLAEAEASKRNYEASLDDARGEATQIIDEAKATAESLRADILAKAEAEAAQIIERAQTEVAAERQRVVQELRAQVGTMSVELASRIVERELDATTHEGLVDEYIQRLSNQN
jgi:F-type H+-transporting ATPase subunit b